MDQIYGFSKEKKFLIDNYHKNSLANFNVLSFKAIPPRGLSSFIYFKVAKVFATDIPPPNQVAVSVAVHSHKGRLRPATKKSTLPLILLLANTLMVIIRMK